MRENRTHGSEGGDGANRFRPLSGKGVNFQSTDSAPPGLEPKEMQLSIRLAIRGDECL